MTDIRPIRADEIDAFLESGGAAGHRDDVRRYLELMFERRTMRPEWCFIARAADGARGRVALWTLPGMDVPLDIVLLDLPWRGRYRPVGVELMDHALAVARSLGADEIGHVIDAPAMPPQWQGDPEERMALLHAAGFVVQRRARRFEWRADDAGRDIAAPTPPVRLRFRPLTEVGEEAFVEALERVSTGSLDARIEEERRRDGPGGAARAMYEIELKLDHDPDWWELAYTPSGELVGLVMPSRNPTTPVIAYIGVTPDHRGHGYVDELLARGTATLRATGAKLIRADTDVANVPMAAAFLRAGYREFASRTEVVRRLADEPAA